MRSKETHTRRGLPGRWALLQTAIGLGVAFWILDAVVSALVYDSGTMIEQLVTPGAERIGLRLLVLAVLAGFGYVAPRLISGARSVTVVHPDLDALSCSIFANVQDGFTVLDSDLNIVHANPWIEAVYSDFQPLVGKKCFEVFQQRQTACTHCPCVEALQNGKPHVEVLPNNCATARAEGTELWAFPLQDPAGEFLGVALHLKDVSKSRTAGDIFRQERDLLSQINETSPVGIVKLDAEGRITTTNVRAEQILGLSREDVRERTYNDPKWRITDFEGKEFPEEKLPFRRVMDTGKAVFDVRYAIELPDGRRVYLSINAAPLFNAAHEPDGMVASIEDVTERKQSADALRESERRLTTLMSNLPGMVYRCLNDENWTMEYVSTGVRELFGYDPDDLLGNNVVSYAELIHPDDRENVWKNVQAGVRDHQPFELTYRIQTKAGEEKWVSEIGRGILASDGTLLALEGFITDITARRRAEQQTQLSEKKFREFYESSRDGYAMVDMEGCIVEANSMFLEMLGYSLEELKQKTYRDITPEKWHAREKTILTEQVMQRGYSELYEKEYIRKDGTIFPIEIRTYLRRTPSGRPLAMWAFVRDLTDRRRAEKALVESEHRFRTLVEETTEGMFCYEYDPPIPVNLPINEQIQRLYEGVLVECNDVCARSYGAESASQVVGQKLSELFGTTPGSLDGLFTAMVESGYRIKDGEGVDISEDGTRRYFLNNGHGVVEQGNLVRVWGTFRDITDRKQTEKALRESEEAKRTLIEAIPDMMFVVDRDGRYLDFYPSRIDQPFVSPDTFLGKTTREVLPPDVAEEHMQCIARALETGEPQISEYAFDLPDGRRYYETRIVASDDNTVLALARNVTDRKLADEALRKEREFNETLINGSPTFFVAIDQNGKTLMMNRAMLAALGYTKEEVVGADYLSTFVPKKDRQELAKIFAQLTKARTATKSENRVIAKDGRTILVEWHDQPVITSAGNLDFFFGVGIDITERKRAEQERDRLFNLSVDMLSVITFEGFFKQVNPAWKRILGWTEAELLSKTWLELIHPDDYEKSVDEGGRLVTGQAVFSLENRCRCKDGSYRWLSWNAFPLTGEGLIFSVTRDITERKRAEEERDRLFNNSIDLLGVVGFDGFFKQVNPAWVRTLGWAESELLDKPWSELVHPDDRPISDEAAERLARGQNLTSFENRMRSIDGSYRWLSWNAIPLPDENLIFAMARDVTERKDAERALIFTQFSVDRAADAAYWMEPDGRIIYVNDAACKSLGYTREEMLALSLADIDPDFQTEKMQGSLELLRNRGSLVLETRHRMKDGRCFPVEINSNHLYFEGREYICAFARDITTRRQAEIELRESEKRYRTLVDTSPVPVMVYVGERFVFLNSAAVTALGGTTVGDFIGRSIWDVLQPDSVESGRSPGWWILEPKGSAGLIRENWVRLDGKSIDVELFAIGIDYRGEPARQVVFNDITERMAAERKLLEYQQQLRALASEVTMTEERERQQIASNLHDGISQNLALAKMQLVNLHETTPSAQTSAPLMHTVELLEQALEHMRSLTFELSPPVLHRLGLEPAVVGLAEQMQEKYGMQIELDISEVATPLPGEVRVMLFRAVRELLINVIKHAQTRRAKISMTKTDRRIIIEVLDYGEGYDPARTELGQQRKEGFGLFSIRERLEYLGGSLNIDSPPGGGTRVLLTAPLAGEMAGKEQ